MLEEAKWGGGGNSSGGGGGGKRGHRKRLQVATVQFACILTCNAPGKTAPQSGSASAAAIAARLTPGTGGPAHLVSTV